MSWQAMFWQYVMWVAGAATVTALLAACLPFLTAAGRPDRPRRSVLAAAILLVFLMVAAVALTGLVDTPAWARALWAVTTAVLAGWVAAHGRELTPRGRRRTPDPLSEQDELVQTLVVASYALQMGDERRARQAVDGALSRSRATLDRLLREHGSRALARSGPATGGNTPS